MKPDDLSCEKYRTETDEYIDGMLDEAAAADFRAHIEKCDECRAVYEAHLAASRAAARAGEELPEGMHDRIMQAVRAESAASRSRRLERLSRRIRIASVGFAAVFCIFAVCFAGFMIPLSLADKSGDAPINELPAGNTSAAVADGDSDPIYDNYPGGDTPLNSDSGNANVESSTRGVDVEATTSAPEVSDSNALPQTNDEAEGIVTTYAPETTYLPMTTLMPDATAAPEITAAPDTTAAPVAAAETTAQFTSGESLYSNASDVGFFKEGITPLETGIIICAVGAVVALVATLITFAFYIKLKKQKKRDIRK